MEERKKISLSSRSTKGEILDQHDIVALQQMFSGIFGAMPGISAIINRNRQIIYANHEFLALEGINSLEPLLGKRPGEALSCINSEKGTDGCGTSVSCQYCGAFNAITDSQLTQEKTVKETSISSIVDGQRSSWDLRVTCTPIALGGMDFYVISLQDISNEKRLMALERIFFHDIMNTAGGLNGLLSILKEDSQHSDLSELISMSEEASRVILEEILLFRQLRAAEKGDLEIKIEKINSVGFLKSVAGLNSYHDKGLNKKITVSENSADIDFYSDKTILQRVITNLLKNAYEATPEGGIVYTGVEDIGSSLRFWVKNAVEMPHDVQMQVFQRSFSTKGTGRGIGTYSVRLLAENYLKGKVSFVSNALEGTVFSVELKKKFPVDSVDK
jgi:nitrogen-specific signal transduction histidine kinase